MNKDLNSSIDFVKCLNNQLVESSDVYIGLAPSYTNLYPIKRELKKIVNVIAQNVHFANHGAFTGEVSVDMLDSIGVTSVIIGHSERREYFNEDTEILIKKKQAVLNKGMSVIYCVGESLVNREQGIHYDFISKQITDVLAAEDVDKLIIAYEPIWAIGTGVIPSPDEIDDMHSHIKKTIDSLVRKEIDIPVIYGGSLNAQNCLDIFDKPNVNGGLVGGASLDIGDFLQIYNSLKATSK